MAREAFQIAPEIILGATVSFRHMALTGVRAPVSAEGQGNLRPTPGMPLIPLESGRSVQHENLDFQAVCLLGRT